MTGQTKMLKEAPGLIAQGPDTMDISGDANSMYLVVQSLVVTWAVKSLLLKKMSLEVWAVKVIKDMK